MSDAVDSLVHFFNDFVGAVIPGTLLLFGAPLAIGGISMTQDLMGIFSGDYGWIVFLSITFALGHILLAIHSTLLKKRLERKAAHVKKDIEKDASYLVIQNELNKLIGAEHLQKAGADRIEFGDLRGIAMTLSSDAAQLGRRFMFIALFCYGVATALAVIVTLALIYHWSEFPLWEDGVFLACGLVVIVLTQLRGEGFNQRALETPYSAAAAELLTKQHK